MDWNKVLKNSSEYRVVKDKGQLAIEAYGALWPYMSPLSLELTAYRHQWQGNALYHLIKAHHYIWPQDIPTWNYWTERRFAAHCEGHKIIVMAGGANCGKSYDAAKLAILFWLANPTARTTLIASTTLTDLDSRIWGYLKRFHQPGPKGAQVELPGVLYTSPPPKILFSKADTIHGMFAVPLQKGTPKKTASTLIGRHPDEGFLAVIDEGTDVSPGFMEAVPNWEKSPFFQMIVIGNSDSMYDPHGILSRPVEGWHTVDPDYDSEWPTKQGICLYFDCYQSPAIHEKDPKKKDLLSRFLFTEEGIAQAAREYGDNSPRFWRFTRGFWPSEDSLQTILTAVMIDKFRAQEGARWNTHSQIYMLAGLDPAFTASGDECILRFAKLGIAENGRWTLDYLGERGILNLIIDATTPEPAEYQILHQARRHCEEMGVDPENLAVDVWGGGSGLGAIFQKNWSEHIYNVASAGIPSNAPTNESGTELAKDVYDRRITELWFSMQRFVLADQIRGLDDISCEQFCTRQYTWKGKKFSIETKEDYKLRMGKVDNRYKSPDRADAACLILDLARQFYRFVPGKTVDPNSEQSLLRQYFNQVRRDIDPHQPEPQARSGHPASWGDGFSASHFDVEENG